MQVLRCDPCEMQGQKVAAAAIYWDFFDKQWNVCLKHLESVKKAGLEYEMFTNLPGQRQHGTDAGETGGHKTSIKTYPEMNAKIVEILRISSDDPALLYAAQRIEELEAETERLHSSLEAILDEATSDHNRDIVITECQSALRENRR